MKNIIKKYKYLPLILIAVLISSISIIVINAATLSTDIINARQNGVDAKNYSGVKVNQTIPSEYSFGLGKVQSRPAYSGVEELSAEQMATFAGSNCVKNGTPSLAVNSIKGNYSALYQNAALYNGKLIDIKATVMDFDVLDPSQDRTVYDGTPIIGLTTTNGLLIETSVENVKWVEVKYEFFEAGTNTPIDVKGYTTYWDVDGAQGILLNNNNTNIYIEDNTEYSNVLKITTVNGKKYVYDDTNINDTKIKTDYAFTETFNGSTLTRTFTYGTPSSSRWGDPGLTSGGMILSTDSVSYVELTSPTKSVSKGTVDIEETFTYTINQQVPQTLQSNYYKEYKIEDTLADCLDINTNNIKVFDANNTEITENFTITTTGQKIIITAKPEFLESADFYGTMFNVNIGTKIKENFNLEPWKNNGAYKIPNQAFMTYKNYNNTEITLSTNEIDVTTIPKYTLTVHHYKEGTTEKLALDEVSTKQHGSSYTTSSLNPMPEGYELVGTPANATGTISEDTTVIYY
ncbi:MAG: isopeptide-forming domain-containing fimbrial protein, partial [Bacilli bacterium]|nr:isopeptide-forming domain-containing fimbrial protein [Bacilli bacterium]